MSNPVLDKTEQNCFLENRIWQIISTRQNIFMEKWEKYQSPAEWAKVVVKINATISF